MLCLLLPKKAVRIVYLKILVSFIRAVIEILSTVLLKFLYINSHSINVWFKNKNIYLFGWIHILSFVKNLKWNNAEMCTLPLGNKGLFQPDSMSLEICQLVPLPWDMSHILFQCNKWSHLSTTWSPSRFKFPHFSQFQNELFYTPKLIS
jgi:hypothetical protein